MDGGSHPSPNVLGDRPKRLARPSRLPSGTEWIREQRHDREKLPGTPESEANRIPAHETTGMTYPMGEAARSLLLHAVDEGATAILR